MSVTQRIGLVILLLSVEFWIFRLYGETFDIDAQAVVSTITWLFGMIIFLRRSPAEKAAERKERDEIE